MEAILNKILLFTILLLAFPDNVIASQEQAQLNAICGREQNYCQSACLNTTVISQCRTECYRKYLRCRGGR